MELIALKRCGGFGRPEHWVLPEGFSKDASKKDGLQPKCKACRAAYQRSPAGKAVQCKAFAKYRAENPDRIKARNAVNDAIKLGHLCPPSELDCNHCGEQAQHWHHWWSYAEEFWFWILPLCRKCHKAEHARLKDS